METNKSVDELIELRKVAREMKNYTLSDEIRNELDLKNVFIFDTPSGQEVYYTLKGTTRQDIINEINQDKRANNMFDAWLFSMNKSKKINKLEK